jgi:hypothetical protein
MPRITDKAIFCQEVDATDIYGNHVKLAVYFDTGSCGVFAIDSSYIEQEEPQLIPSPFNDDVDLELTGD